MQRRETIDKNRLYELFDFIFSDSSVQVYESYSQMEEKTVQINDKNGFNIYFQKAISENAKNLGFVIYYPESKGSIFFSKIKLNPDQCNGKTYRYRTDGWGLIAVHLDVLNKDSEIVCSVSANSEKRATNWKSINPEFGDPDLWKWKIVESKTRSIIYRLKKLHTEF